MPNVPKRVRKVYSSSPFSAAAAAPEVSPWVLSAGVSAAEILDEDRWDYLEAATQTEYSVSDGGASIGGGRYPGRNRKRPRHKF